MTQSDYMINNPTETVFEDVIAAYLAASPLYNLRTSADFDINRMCNRKRGQSSQSDLGRKLLIR